MKFHFMNGTMRATSSKKMTAILLGLTMTLAPYGMTSAEAVQAAEHPAAAAAAPAHPSESRHTARCGSAPLPASGCTAGG